MTEITGVGLGTFYEYFAQKQDLIALTIRQYVKQSTLAFNSYTQSCMELSTGVDILTYLSSLIHVQIKIFSANHPFGRRFFCLNVKFLALKSIRNIISLCLNFGMRR